MVPNPRNGAIEWQARTSLMACEQRGSMLALSLAPKAVGMIPAYAAMLTPCWQPKAFGHQQTEYMTVQAILVLAFGERSIHDNLLLFLFLPADAVRKLVPIE